ncbi:UNVERIFIED_CONTAM: hypothetical protein K2H54_022394 [Gekko kuhli]
MFAHTELSPGGSSCFSFPMELSKSKLVKYFSRQLSCKRKVALQERNAKLEGFPQLLHWFRIVNIRKEVMEVSGFCFLSFVLVRLLALWLRSPPRNNPLPIRFATGPCQLESALKVE